MAQSRKSIYSLGGPEYLPDPRVQEAQNWLQLGQAGAAQRMARDAQIASAQAGLRSAAIRAAAQQGDADLKRQLAQLEADARLSEAAMREQGWTAREETRQAGEDRRQTGRDSAAWERALLEAGLADKREAAASERAAEQQDRADARARRGDLLGLLRALPSAKDRFETDAAARSWVERVGPTIDLTNPRAARDQLAGYSGHPGYSELLRKVGPDYAAAAGETEATGSMVDRLAGLPGAYGAVGRGAQNVRAVAERLNPFANPIELFQQAREGWNYLSQPQPAYPDLGALPPPQPSLEDALVRELLSGQ